MTFELTRYAMRTNFSYLLPDTLAMETGTKRLCKARNPNSKFKF
jgi:hypothetical protein